MADAGEVRVKLTADVSEYVDAMKRAAQATRRLSKAYRRLPRAARIIARLSATRSISVQTLTDNSTTRRMAGPKVH